MKTICTLLDSTPNTAIALNTITTTIPCFISITDNGTVTECTITARQEDMAYVERELAALVQHTQQHKERDTTTTHNNKIIHTTQ